MAPPPLVLDDRYQLDDRIAVGGMGEVWRATDRVLGRPVAVKLLRPAYAEDEAGLARFRAEARYAARLSHPNIAHVYDYWGGDPPGQPYLVMELVDGPSLAGLLADGPLSPERTLRVISQAAAGLQAAHVAGVVHRDIKPGNLLINAGGLVKIADFGIAHAVGSAPVTRTGEVIGTPAYLSPEQAIGRSATPASDLYALGIVAYQCLAGEPPFTGEPLAVALAHQEQGLPELPASVPPGVAALIGHLAAKDPRERPASAGAVARRAERLRASLIGGPATLPGLPELTGPLPAATMMDLPVLNAQPASEPAGTPAAGGTAAAESAADGTATADSEGAPRRPGSAEGAGAPAAGTAAVATADAAAAKTADSAAAQAAPDGATAGAAGAALPPAPTAPAGAAGTDGAAGTAAIEATRPGTARSAGTAPDGPAATGAPGPRAWREATGGLAGRAKRILSGRAPMRTGLAAAGIVVFGVAGWALSTLPGQAPSHQHQPPVPAAPHSGHATPVGIFPSGPPDPHTVATPGRGRHSPEQSSSASPSASASASPSVSATPTPTAAPSSPPGPTPTASQPATQPPSPPPSASPSPTSSLG